MQVQSSTIQSVQYITVQYSTAYYSIVQHSPIQHSSAQHSTVHHSAVLSQCSSCANPGNWSTWLWEWSPTSVPQLQNRVPRSPLGRSRAEGAATLCSQQRGPVSLSNSATVPPVARGGLPQSRASGCAGGASRVCVWASLWGVRAAPARGGRICRTQISICRTPPPARIAVSVGPPPQAVNPYL